VSRPVASIPAAPIAGSVADDSSRLSSRANLEAAGRQFEAVFDAMMLKSMRQAKLSDGLFDSKALDTFRDMQDQQVAKLMSEHAPIGIGKAMVDFLAKSQAGLQPPAPPAAAPADPVAGALPIVGDGS
jgi:flagellar protein FlgJ